MESGFTALLGFEVCETEAGLNLDLGSGAGYGDLGATNTMRWPEQWSNEVRGLLSLKRSAGQCVLGDTGHLLDMTVGCSTYMSLTKRWFQDAGGRSWTPVQKENQARVSCFFILGTPEGLEVGTVLHGRE